MYRNLNLIGLVPHPSNNVELENLDEVFTYHPPVGTQLERYQTIRRAAKDLAHEILVACPPCPDRSAAIRKLRECVMTANAAVALEDRTAAEAFEAAGQGAKVPE